MMLNIENIREEDLLSRVKTIKEQEYRLVTITAVKVNEGIELTYHFDLNFNLVNLRYVVDGSDAVQSISPIYPGAFLIENEYQDLFGLKFENLIIDYEGRLYLTDDSPEHPLAGATAGATTAAKGA